jgi:hypothetical protein
MSIGEMRPQEVQATEVEAPRVVADLQLAVEDCSSVALWGSTAAPLQQQLTAIQVMDEAYNIYMSNMKMKRPPHPLYSNGW